MNILTLQPWLVLTSIMSFFAWFLVVYSAAASGRSAKPAIYRYERFLSGLPGQGGNSWLGRYIAVQTPTKNWSIFQEKFGGETRTAVRAHNRWTGISWWLSAVTAFLVFAAVVVTINWPMNAAPGVLQTVGLLYLCLSLMSITLWIFDLRWERRALAEWKVLHSGNLIAAESFRVTKPWRRRAAKTAELDNLERYLIGRYQPTSGESWSAKMRRTAWLDRLIPVIERRHLFDDATWQQDVRIKTKTWLDDIAAVLLSRPRKTRKRSGYDVDALERISLWYRQSSATRASKKIVLTLLAAGTLLLAMAYGLELVFDGRSLGPLPDWISGTVALLTSILVATTAVIGFVRRARDR